MARGVAAVAAAVLLLAAEAIPLKPCPPTNVSTGNANCFFNETCCTEQYFGASGCEVLLPNNQTTCCAPGPPLNISTTLPNCLVIGDSVSDQYTPSVASLMNATCLVQHAPWVGGGSANDVANGLFNLMNCRWLRTALRPDQDVKWDLIAFNFGLHDLMHTWPAELALYSAQLSNITDILQVAAKKVVYILTTPYQPDALPACGEYCNAPNATVVSDLQPTLGDWPQPTNGGNGRCGPPQCAPGSLGCGVPNATAKANSSDPNAPGCGPPTYAVTVLNDAAKTVMAAHNVPVFDLNSVVHARCGANYSSCDMCDNGVWPAATCICYNLMFGRSCSTPRVSRALQPISPLFAPSFDACRNTIRGHHVRVPLQPYWYSYSRGGSGGCIPRLACGAIDIYCCFCGRS